MTSEPMRPQPPFVSTRTSAQTVGALFVATAAVSWIAAGYDLGEIRVVHSIQEGGSIEAAQRLAHARAGWVLALAQIACAAALSGAFVPWLYRVRVNLRALGVRRLRHGREWTYLAFLIPGVNLVRPYQVVSEIWRGSDPSARDPLAWQQLRASPLVVGWWAALVAWLAIGGFAWLLLELATGLARIQLAHALAFAGDACAALSASLGILVVTRISRAQDAKWEACAHRQLCPAGGRPTSQPSRSHGR